MTTKLYSAVFSYKISSAAADRCACRLTRNFLGYTGGLPTDGLTKELVYGDGGNGYRCDDDDVFGQPLATYAGVWMQAYS